MGGTGECAGIRPQLGCMSPGRLPPADRAALVRHLASCQRCRDELAGLATLPGLLRRLPARLLRRLPARADAQPPGAGAAAPKRDSGEALLSRVLSRMAAHRRRRRWALATAATVLAAAAAAGWALRPGSPPSGPAAAGTILETERIGGVTVLADAAGFTLYWFAPDTAARSHCTGSCAPDPDTTRLRRTMPASASSRSSARTCARPGPTAPAAGPTGITPGPDRRQALLRALPITYRYMTR